MKILAQQDFKRYLKLQGVEVPSWEEYDEYLNKLQIAKMIKREKGWIYFNENVISELQT